MLGRRFTSSRIRKERKKRLMIQATLWIMLAIAILFLVVEVVHLKQLRIERVRFEGNKAVATEELWEILKPHVEGDYAYLFSKKNVFIVPTEKIEGDLKEQFVRLKDVSIYREGLHTLVVKSTERTPAGLWCGEAEAMRTCYYLDDNGLAFAAAPRLTGGTFITYTRSFPENVIGESIADSGEFHELRGFMDSLEPLGFATESVAWKDDAIDLSVRASLDEGRSARLVLKIPLMPPYDKSFSNLASVMQESDTDTVAFSPVGIDYIDLRFENKVFYKKRGVETETIAE